MHNSVLSVSNEDGSVIGTGFVVSVDKLGAYIVTCGHVINDCQGAPIFVDGEASEVIDNRYEEGIDLAILYTKGITHKPLTIALGKGPTAKVIGYSKLLGDLKRETIHGVKIKADILVAKNRSVKIKAIKLYPDESIGHGYSGAPVICEVTKSVIGIVNIQVGGDENYAISSEHLDGIIGCSITNQVVTNEGKKVGILSSLTDAQQAIISNKLSATLENALSSFTTQNNLWVTPHVDKAEEEKGNGNTTLKIDLNDIIQNPRTIMIKARQQYGATSLAHFLIKTAWENYQPSFWLYIDANKITPHKKSIEKYVSKALAEYSLAVRDIECIVLDELSTSTKNVNDILVELCSLYKDKPMLVMYSELDNPLLNQSIKLPRDFEILHLWALDRRGMRQLVSNYKKETYVDEESKVLNKVVSDLDALNIPRTPQNCLTILKISEIDFDDSPVNRTEMIRRVLHLLFNVDDIPNYKTRPDLKDTEFTLGFFCERIIRSKKVEFTRASFIADLSGFCRENEIDLEVQVIFDVLAGNNIIVERNNSFCFKFTYWVFYFASHRMLQDIDFANYILCDLNYINYPELIEFYTGIDRRRTDALKVITRDLCDIRGVVNRKCNLPEDFKVYDLVKWEPSEEHLQILHEEVSSGVAQSNLPNEVKDDYADRAYDRTKPLKQSFQNILEEYSLLRLMQAISAASLALRNSDHAPPNLRHMLLDEILASWEVLTNVLVVFTPALANAGEVSVEGINFSLTGAFAKEPEVRLHQIVGAIPSNIITWYVDKLFSQKMGPLLKNKIKSERRRLLKHYLNLTLICKRPRGWEEVIQESIVDEDKNSFYLSDTLSCLKAEYRYSFASYKDLQHTGNLIKMIATKHQYGIKRPTMNRIRKLSDSILPKRDI